MTFPGSPRSMYITALLLFLLFGGAIELFYHAGRHWLNAERQLQTLSHAATVRARIESELNAVLFLNNGLSSYLLVKHDTLDPDEVRAILSNVYRQSRHIRNFGIAIGYRLNFIYPEEGNQAAIGLDYRSQAEQWPLIEHHLANHQAMLAGPLPLKQGGTGIVYRTPIYVGERYWGLLSTVIDKDSIFAAAGLNGRDRHYEHALRGKDGLGAQGATFLGSPALFDDPAAVIMEIGVPAGHWLLAVKPGYGHRQLDRWLLFARLAGWLFGGLFAYLALAWLRLHGRMADLALYDSLTSLPNRNLLMDRLAQTIQRSERQNSPFSLLYIDLDGFKEINDTLGHKVGDLVLMEVATRLTGALRRSDTVTRWGGDEFIVLLGNTDRESAINIAEQLRKEVDAPIDSGDQEVKVGASIGIAVYPMDGDTSTCLMKIADMRMYHEKDRRKRGAEPGPASLPE